MNGYKLVFIIFLLLILLVFVGYKLERFGKEWYLI